MESQCLSILRATTPLYPIRANDPRPRWDVSVRLTLGYIESGSFRIENKRRISKFPVALGRSVQSYVKKKDNIKGGAASSAARQFWVRNPSKANFKKTSVTKTFPHNSSSRKFSPLKILHSGSNIMGIAFSRPFCGFIKVSTAE